MWPANSPDLNLVDMQCGEPCSSKCIAMTVWNCATAETGNRGWVSKFIDRSMNEWRPRLKCVVQTNGRHIEHLLKQLFSRRLYTAFLLQFMHISELYSFIDLFCKLYICTHALLCGATYRSGVKLSISHIGLFVINCCLCVSKSIRFGQSMWKIRARYRFFLLRGISGRLPGTSLCV